jgi:hypothetical protein
MLKSLYIRNFRCLEDFRVSKLGRVNLIVGRNNSGKSSVLEAIRVYAGNAQRDLLEEIAAGRGERIGEVNIERSEIEEPLPFEELFAGRRFPSGNQGILIGESEDSDQTLQINRVFQIWEIELVDDETEKASFRAFLREHVQSPFDQYAVAQVGQALSVKKGDQSTSIVIVDAPRPRQGSGYRVVIDQALQLGVTPCSFAPATIVHLDELAQIWDRIVFSDHEEVVKDALRIIAPDFDDLAFVRFGDSYPKRSQNFARTARVKITGSPHPVPLQSLGDGMLRVLQLVLMVFPAKGGFLLIDEFENGLHHSVQEKVWALVFELASRLDIQVFATTHSWDCIESFAKVAYARKDVEGVLFRVGRSVRTSDQGRVIATVFDEDELYSITQADVEVR